MEPLTNRFNRVKARVNYFRGSFGVKMAQNATTIGGGRKEKHYFLIKGPRKGIKGRLLNYFGGLELHGPSKLEIQNNWFGDDILSQGLEGHEIIRWHSLNNLQIIYPTKICTNYSSGQWVVKIISIKKKYFEKIILERHVALKIICPNNVDFFSQHTDRQWSPVASSSAKSQSCFSPRNQPTKVTNT